MPFITLKVKTKNKIPTEITSKRELYENYSKFLKYFDNKELVFEDIVYQFEYFIQNVVRDIRNNALTLLEEYSLKEYMEDVNCFVSQSENTQLSLVIEIYFKSL